VERRSFHFQTEGKTLGDSWNPKPRIASRLRDLVAIIHEEMSNRLKESLYSERRQPRRKVKSVIRVWETEEPENAI